MIIYYAKKGHMKGKIVIAYPEIFEEKNLLKFSVIENGEIVMTESDLEYLILGPLESMEIEDPMTPHFTKDFIVDLTDKKHPKIKKTGLELKAFTKDQKRELKDEFDRIYELRKLHPHAKIRLHV